MRINRKYLGKQLITIGLYLIVRQTAINKYHLMIFPSHGKKTGAFVIWGFFPDSIPLSPGSPCSRCSRSIPNKVVLAKAAKLFCNMTRLYDFMGYLLSLDWFCWENQNPGHHGFTIKIMGLSCKISLKPMMLMGFINEHIISGGHHWSYPMTQQNLEKQESNDWHRLGVLAPKRNSRL